MARVSDAVKLEREKRKTAREAEARALLQKTLLSPNMIRLAMIAGIIAYSTHEARSPTNVGPVRSALAFALPGIGIPLIAADAGIRDKWALGAISAAGVGYVTGQMGAGWLGAMAGGNNPFPIPGANDLSDLSTALVEPGYDLVSGILDWMKNLGGPGVAPWN